MESIHSSRNVSSASPLLPSSPPTDSFLLPFVPPDVHLVVSMFLLLPLVYVTYRDYYKFLSLGPGGTPANFYGYMKITFLRIFALSNPHSADPVPAELQNTGFLNRALVHPRPSARPEVVGIAPHRQTNQLPDKDIFNLLSASIMQLAKDHPDKFRIATSAFEKHCPGLFSVKKANPTCNGEVCHAHPSDGSMHMTLHPEDIKTVLEARWGERHPLARGGWCSRFVPKEFVMIYAPRSKLEVDTVMEIIKAGVGWISGEAFSEDTPDVEKRTKMAAPTLDAGCMDHRCGAVAS